MLQRRLSASGARRALKSRAWCRFWNVVQAFEDAVREIDNLGEDGAKEDLSTAATTVPGPQLALLSGVCAGDAASA